MTYDEYLMKLKGKPQTEEEWRELFDRIEKRQKMFFDMVEENKLLKDDIEARKFAMAMSEKVEKQLREQIEKMKCCYNCKFFDASFVTCNLKDEDVIDGQCCNQWEMEE